MQDKTILIEQRPGYRVITLHRPQRLNAFSEKGVRAFLGKRPPVFTARRET